MKLYQWTLSAGALALATPALAQDKCATEEDRKAVLGLDVAPMFKYAGDPDLVIESREGGATLTWVDDRTSSAVVIQVGEKNEILAIDFSPKWLEGNANPIDIFIEPPP